MCEILFNHDCLGEMNNRWKAEGLGVDCRSAVRSHSSRITMPECTKDMREESMKIDVWAKSLLGQRCCKCQACDRSLSGRVDVTETEGVGTTL